MELNLDKSKSYVVGFSGGADSALLSYLLKEQGYSVRLIHVNHMFSKASKDAKEIQSFCETWAFTHNLSLSCFNIHEALSHSHLKCYGTEAAEREARYKILTDNLEANEILLTGHHLNDSVENIFMRICRGTSVKGLTGIQYESKISGKSLIRPLINLTKTQILSLCESQLLLYRHDSTNEDISLTRGFVRNKIVPLLEEHFSPNKLYASLQRLMENMSECSELISDLYSIDFASCKIDKHRVLIGALLQLSATRQRNFIYHFVAKQTGVYLTKNHVNEVLKKLQSPTTLRIKVGKVEVFVKDNTYFYVRNLNSN